MLYLRTHVGEGVVTTIENGEKRSYTIREGHVFVAPAGAVTYLANTDGRRKLVIAKILHTISVPGKFQVTIYINLVRSNLPRHVSTVTRLHILAVFLRPRREEPGVVPVEFQQTRPESCLQGKYIHSQIVHP